MNPSVERQQHSDDPQQRELLRVCRIGRAQGLKGEGDEGGRHTPFFNNYRPQFYFRTTDVTVCCTLPEGVEMVMPGDNVNLEVQLITPIAMEKAMRFAIREGGRTVGAGVVAKIAK